MKIAFLFLLLWLQNAVSAQVSAELPKMNVMYIGLPNPLNVVAEGVKHEDLRLSCDRCTIADSNGQYIVYVSKRGDLNIYIKHKNGDTLAVKNYRVRSIPKPELRLGTLESGTHSKGAIMAQPGLYATLGEGFGYTGVKFLVDSAIIRLTTTHETIECHQAGTRLLPEIKSRLSDVISMEVTSVYVSLHDAEEPYQVRLSPLFIREKTHPYYYFSDIDGTNMSRVKLRVNECRVIQNDSLFYLENGRRHVLITNHKEDQETPNFVHLIDGDTLEVINAGNYTLKSEAGTLIEKGSIIPIPDSISNRVVQGEAVYFGGTYLERDTFNILYLSKRFCPVGLWEYYHENGQLRSTGSYKVGGVSYINTDWFYYDYNKKLIPKQIEIIRTGTWKFYDENGQLILEKEYP